MNSNIDFQSVCLGTILYSSTEIIDFSWQLYFFLVNFKSEIWQIYVIRRHHCQSTRGSCLPLLIFSYKGISSLYLVYEYVGTFLFCVYWSKNWTKKLTPPPHRLRTIFYHLTRVSVVTYINLETCKIQGWISYTLPSH